MEPLRWSNGYLCEVEVSNVIQVSFLWARRALERLLGADVRHLVVLQLDLVADTTMVDVRFKVPRVPRAPQAPLEEVAAAHPNGATA